MKRWKGWRRRKWKGAQVWRQKEWLLLCKCCWKEALAHRFYSKTEGSWTRKPASPTKYLRKQSPTGMLENWTALRKQYTVEIRKLAIKSSQILRLIIYAAEKKKKEKAWFPKVNMIFNKRMSPKQVREVHAFLSAREYVFRYQYSESCHIWQFKFSFNITHSIAVIESAWIFHEVSIIDAT